MSREPTLRQPYGPGWEDPDWQPHGEMPDEAAAMKLEAEPVARETVGSLAEFMAVLKRFARPRRDPAAPAGQRRRWVIAGGAGLFALAALPSHAKPASVKQAPRTAADGGNDPKA